MTRRRPPRRPTRPTEGNETVSPSADPSAAPSTIRTADPAHRAPSPDAAPPAGAPSGPIGGPVRTAPVSGLQRGLWFLDRWNARDTTYTTPWTYEVTGPLDLPLLQRALDGIVARHEALRTTFALHPDGPRQHVHRALAVPLTVTDLRALPEPERGDQAERLLTERAARPFDLTTGPLLRAEAFRLADDRTTLLFVVHHIVWDGWSAELFERELAELHAAASENRPPSSPRSPPSTPTGPRRSGTPPTRSTSPTGSGASTARPPCSNCRATGPGPPSAADEAPPNPSTSPPAPRPASGHSPNRRASPRSPSSSPPSRC